MANEERTPTSLRDPAHRATRATRTRAARPKGARPRAPTTAALREPGGGADPAGADLFAITTARLSAALAAPRLGPGDLAALIPLAERLAAEQARRAYARALAQLQAELPEIPERGEIRDPDGRALGAYALWEDCAALLRAPLARHGFALSFRTQTQAGALSVTARLSHHGGHVEETALSMPFDASGWKNPLQAIGSAASYGKRYATQALLNLISRGDDDDARAAGGDSGLGAAALQGLRDQLIAAGASEDRLARYLGVAALAALPASRLAEAQAALAALSFRRGA